MLWKQSCMFFMNVVRRLMATHADIVFVCPQDNSQSLSHPEWKLEGKSTVFFFSSTPKSPPICWLGGKEDVRACVRVYLSMSICVYAWVYAPVHLCTWMHTHAWVCFYFMSLRTFECHTLTSRSGSAPQGTLSWKQTKTNPVSSFFPASVCMCASIT